MKNMLKPITIIFIMVGVIIAGLSVMTWKEYENEKFKTRAIHTISKSEYKVIAIYGHSENKLAPSMDVCSYRYIQYLSLKNNKISIVENILDADIAICI